MEHQRPHMRRFVVVGVLASLLFILLLILFQRSLPTEAPWPNAFFVHQRILYPAEPAGAVEVDGLLGEWGDALWAPLGTPWQARGNWRGRRDAEARVAMRWDKEAMYVAAKVRDDRFVSPDYPDVDGGDAIVIGIGGETLRLAPATAPKADKAYFLHQSAISRFDAAEEGSSLSPREPLPPGERGKGGGEGGAEYVPSRTAWRAAPSGYGPYHGVLVDFDATGLPFLGDLDLLDAHSGHSGAGLSDGWGAPARRVPTAWERPVPGRRARLELPVLFDGDLELTFLGTAFAGGANQRFTLFANGERIGVFPEEPWIGERRISATVPASALKRGMNDFLLEFAFTPQPDPEAEGPTASARSRSGWFRKLNMSAWFRKIHVRPLGEPGRQEAESAPPEILFAADASGDGRDELVGLAQGRPFAIGPRTAWGWAAEETVPDALCAAAGDLTGDGDPDVAVLGEGGRAVHLFTPNTGVRAVLPLPDAASFPGTDRPEPDAASWRAMLIVDTNRDGENELVGLSDSAIEVVALHGGEWVGMQRLPAPAGARWAFWDDFLAEGRPLLAVIAVPLEGMMEVRLWRPTYDGLVPVEEQWSLFFEAEHAAVGDFAGEGVRQIYFVARVKGGGMGGGLFSPLKNRLRLFSKGPSFPKAVVGGNFDGALPPPVGTPVVGLGAYRPLPKPDEDETVEEEDAPQPPRPAPGYEAIPGSRIVSLITEYGFDVEARIPWESLGMSPPRPGQRMEFTIEYVDDDGGRRPNRLLYSDPRTTARVEFLRGKLPWKLGSRHARFLGGLTVGGLGGEPLLPEDEPTVEILKGATPGRLPPLESLILSGRKSGASRARRLEPTESLGCEIERWKLTAGRLPDGDAELVGEYGRPFRQTALRTLAESRAGEYRRTLAAARKVEAELRAMVPDFPQVAPTLLTRAMVEAVQLERLGASGRGRALDDAGKAVRELQSLAALARRGGGKRLDDALEEPLRAYWCDIDGSPQPYELRVPPDYEGDRAWPLVVHLRGAGYSPTRSTRAPEWDEAFNLAPHGRGWTDYMYLGEDSVLRAIAHVRARYRIDPDRIYITGSSMGGTGAWHLASRHPHLFAAIAPVCANSDADLWQEKWGPFWQADDPSAELRSLLLSHLSPVTYAENLANVHVLAAHGARDLVVYPEASRRMVGRLREAGASPIYREEPRAAHRVPARARDGMREWLLSQRRNATPRRVFLRAAMPGHDAAHWVRIERKSSPLAIAEVEAKIVRQNEIEIRTEHVEALVLDLGEFVVGQAPSLSHEGVASERDTGVPDRQDACPTPARGRWGMEGASALAHDAAFTLRGDGKGENPSASFRISPPPGQRGPWVTVALWMRKGASDPGPVRVEIRPSRLDGKLAADSPRLARPLAGRGVRPQAEWQRVALYARLDEKQDGALVCNVSLGGEPTHGELLVAKAGAWFGQEPLHAFHRDPGAPEAWLTSDERRPGGWFPWVPVGQEMKTVGAGFQPAPTMRADGGGCATLPSLIDPAQPLLVRVNGEIAFNGFLPEEGTVRIGSGPPSPPTEFGEAAPGSGPDGGNGGLESCMPEWVPPTKDDRIRGPIEHVFQGPFMLVYGTRGTKRENMEARREAETLLDDWRLRYQVPCRIKPDFAVTEEDIRQYHLVLYGGPQANSLTARVNDDLPVRVVPDPGWLFFPVPAGAEAAEHGMGFAVAAGDEIFSGPDVGMQAIHPNPLNPSRYVVVLASTTWRGMFQMAKRFGNWFGWRIYENRMWYDFAVFDDVSRGPGSFLKFGFFGEDWRLSPETAWRGDEAWRASLPRRGTPHLLLPDPERGTTYLSEMSPESVNMRMGAPGFDRSFRGNPLRPGGAERERGLGVRVETEMTWRLGGKADRFVALVGVDNEGEIPTEERQRWTRVRFEVWGDGRRLAASSVHRWYDPPEELTADVSGVEQLTLRTVPRGGRSWVYGSASWGDARVERGR